MFRASVNATVLKDAIMAVSTLVDEARLRISGNSLVVRAVDPANVAFVSLNMDSKAFESYEATDGEIGVSLDRLYDILGMASKEDRVELCLNEEARRLEVRIGDLEYNLSLLNPSSIKEPKAPNLELPARVVLGGWVLRRIVKAAEKVSGATGYMALGVKDGVFYAESSGEVDSFKLEIPYNAFNRGIITVESKADAHSVYSLGYLDDLVKAMGGAERVSIDLGTDLPVRFSFDVSSGCSIVYLLAPRVESE